MQMCICGIRQISSGCVELLTGEESAFFVRLDYISDGEIVERLCAARQDAPAIFDGAECDAILDAGLAYAAERAASNLLARAEQCRAGLSRKLLARRHCRHAIEQALDFLERQGCLSDARFASCWLRSHAITKNHGRSRLAAELASRGIAKDCAAAALDEFFSATDEELLCSRAYEKYRRCQSDPGKITAYLVRSGFSFKLIKKVAARSANDNF